MTRSIEILGSLKCETTFKKVLEGERITNLFIGSAST